jgi:hypothetical protein
MASIFDGMQPRSLGGKESSITGGVLKALTRICDKASVVAGAVRLAGKHCRQRNVRQSGNKQAPPLSQASAEMPTFKRLPLDCDKRFRITERTWIFFNVDEKAV